MMLFLTISIIMTYDDMFFKHYLKSIKVIEQINIIILIIFHNVIFKFVVVEMKVQELYGFLRRGGPQK